MKRVRHLALFAAALLASISLWPCWPAQAGYWLATRSYNPVDLLEWLVCPHFNALGGGCDMTLQEQLVRALVVGGVAVAAGIARLFWKARTKDRNS